MRKITLLTAMFFFAMFAMQATLCVHDICEEKSCGHDPKSCPICQQLLALTCSIMVDEQTTVNQAPSCERSLIFHIKVIPAISTFHTLGPRAPPFVC